MTTTRAQSGRSSVTVEFNDAQAQRVFVRFAKEDAKKRAQKVLRAAKQEAPVGKTGELANSITVTQSRETTGQWSAGFDVTANAPYAVFVHEGTRPHKIVGHPLLAFFWPKVGRFVAFHSVNHPGTKPNRFLVRALRRAR